MLTNYIRIAVRSLRRRPGYAALNLVGLAVGMACCLLIGLYVQNELSYDRFHPASDRIVRVAQATDDGGLATIGDGIMPVLQNGIPQVERAVQVRESNSTLKLAREQDGTMTRFEEENVLFADSTFFDVFAGFELRRGDPSTALSRPGTIVLTLETARRYFGDEDPMGKTLIREGEDDQGLTVTGVLEPIPANSHLRFDFVTSMGTWFAALGYPAGYQSDSFWFPMAWTYARLQPDADRALVEQQVTEILASQRRAEVAERYAPTLQPLPSIHLHSNMEGDPAGQGSITQVYVFGAIALFVLLIAAVNFVNLATARATERATEVGVRKSIGAQRGQLVGQFLAESMLLSVGAAALALLITQAALPVFTTVLGKALAVGLWTNAVLWVGIVAIVLVTGVGAGSYPAFVLSGFRPVSVLKHLTARGRSRGAWLRKGLVVVQFAISVALIAATAVAYSQLEYLRTAQLGFNEEQIVTMDAEGNYRTLRTALARRPEVASVTGASVTPGLGGSGTFRYEINGEPPSDAQERINTQQVDTGFFETLGVETIAGRTLSADRRSDLGRAKPEDDTHFTTYYREQALVVNRATLDKFGWTPEEALGKRIRLYVLENETIYQDYEGEVVGVVENYHTTSLRQEISPVVYMPARLPPLDPGKGPQVAVSSILVRMAPGTLSQGWEALRSAWTEVLPTEPFAASILADRLQAQYASEQRLGQVVGIFSVLALFVACLGLFGLATYTTQQRTKEIGIRKAVGASVTSIVGLLSADFLKLVAGAILIGTPLAYLAVQRWLQNFAYHVDLGPVPFVLAAGSALAIAGLTVSYHALRAARTDPATTLRDE
ncbi:ABC transporter permease [Salinibacter ruber]|uniref:ABC transport system permease protein n=1 Tax=Salinibacter ruber TaxID=146919 RepID=A0A9X2U363_9BACT|nr:ABC transporter permease [Salinibacter ruber]MCS3858685.1 putative ABC transport system permease protein [Salinibacter ruber]MCS3865636.1 putative ABC transport system permease protein [Salinibacter ruber]MCS4151094.1 putative ABC transport system permease protein [Salinibacter ruber]